VRTLKQLSRRCCARWALVGVALVCLYLNILQARAQQVSEVAPGMSVNPMSCMTGSGPYTPGNCCAPDLDRNRCCPGYPDQGCGCGVSPLGGCCLGQVNVGCGCGVSRINGCCPGQTNVGCGCGISKAANGCCPGQTNVGCGCGVSKAANGCCPGVSNVGCGCGVSKNAQGCCPGQNNAGCGCGQPGPVCGRCGGSYTVCGDCSTTCCHAAYGYNPAIKCLTYYGTLAPKGNVTYINGGPWIGYFENKEPHCFRPNQPYGCANIRCTTGACPAGNIGCFDPKSTILLEMRSRREIGFIVR